jgi:hypothetical protein
LQAALIFDQLQRDVDLLNVLRDALVDQAQILFGSSVVLVLALLAARCPIMSSLLYPGLLNEARVFPKRRRHPQFGFSSAILCASAVFLSLIAAASTPKTYRFTLFDQTQILARRLQLPLQ